MHMLPTTMASATFFFSMISAHRSYGVSLSMITKQSQKTPTPYDLWAEIIEKKNVALAIVVGAMCIAIGMIVAAAVHG